MKIITENEIKQFAFRVRKNPVYKELDKLSVGEALMLPKLEWGRKTHPAILISSIFKNKTKRFRTRQTPDKLNYVIIRIV